MERRQRPRVGDELGPLEQRIDQERMNEFAQVSGSNGRIHLDPTFAVPRWGSTLAQGMLVLDPICQLMICVCSLRGWLEHGRLEAKFVGYTRPGDTVTTRATVEELSEQEGRTLITCRFQCETQDGRTVIVGTARGALLEETPGWRCPI